MPFFKVVKSYFYLLLSAEPTNPLCLLDDPKKLPFLFREGKFFYLNFNLMIFLLLLRCLLS